MRPRRFIFPQTGTGGYGIRPYVFCGDGEGHVFPCCVCRGDHWSPANLPPQRIFRDSFLVRQAGTGEQCSPLQIFFDSLSPKYPCPPHGSLPHRLRAEPPRRGGQERAVPRAEFSPFVGNEIRRGAFYMRPRRFILPQAGTGGYGIRPYVFCGGGEGHVFPCCVCRGDHWSPANLPPQRIFRDSFLVRQAGTGEQCSPLQIFFDSLSPKYPCPPHGSLPHRLRAEPPRRGGQERAVPRVEFSPFVGNVIRRGAFYMRPRKFILPQTGTGGYGIRPYVFETAEHQPSRA